MTVPWQETYGAVLLPAERRWLKDTATDVAERFGQPTIVNIGVFEYASMYCLRAGAPEARLVGIDITKLKQPHKELQAKFIWGDSRVVHADFYEPIHLLFVDGDHSYATVKVDIANWAPKIVPGGVVAFHDYAPTKKNLIKHKLEGVRRAIDEWAATSGWKRIPAPRSLAAFQRPHMKFIEDLRDTHLGEEIWVVGAGRSLDAYPIDFFKNKTCIGVNYVFSVFLDVGDDIEKFSSRKFYSVFEHREPADWVAKRIPEHLKDCFFLLPPERRTSSRPGHKMVWWEDYNKDPYYMRWGLKGRGAVTATDEDFVAVAKCIMERKGPCHYVCRGTTLHWAIQAAAVLGAKKIYLVGAEVFGQYMRKHGSFYQKPRKKKTALRRPWLVAQKHLADVFRPYGVEIVYYYYDTGEQIP